MKIVVTEEELEKLITDYIIEKFPDLVIGREIKGSFVTRDLSSDRSEITFEVEITYDK